MCLSGCIPVPPTAKMYPGPQLDKNIESTIITTTAARTWDELRIRIILVDGKSALNFFKAMYYGNATEVKVAPGKHDIRLSYSAGFQYIGDFWLVTCPGKTYIAKADAEYGVKMWIEDAETGKKVGGVKGSADEPKTKDVPCNLGEKKQPL